jgi:uncharacterized protein with PIN domain
MNEQLFEECPYCNQDLSLAIAHYFRGHLPGNYFEFECPNCNEIMDVEVQAVPEFYTSKQESTQ